MLHIAIQILIWGFIYTAWSMMGRFGLTSFGHGAFLGVGAYVPALLWNFYGLTPWLGIPAGMALAVLLALVIGYPSFRLRVVGHYFALVTLALSQVVLLSLIAARDLTGGSLGMTLKTVGHSWFALQFAAKGLFLRDRPCRLARSGSRSGAGSTAAMARAALDAISEDETAAAASGIDVMREKLRVTRRRAPRSPRFGGTPLDPIHPIRQPGDRLRCRRCRCRSSLPRSPAACMSARADGRRVVYDRAERGMRIVFGIHFIGAANTIYGILLILFIIFMPRGIVGLAEEALARTLRPRVGIPATRAGRAP